MLRCKWNSRTLKFGRLLQGRHIVSRCLSTPAKGLDDEDHREARAWLATFSVNAIPKKICNVTFSRSSGPGGQNVNKVNSKATLSVRTQDLMHLVPKILHSHIEASPYHAKNSKSLIIRADQSRDRTNNVQECYNKLHALLVAAGKSSVRGETLPVQVEKVKNLQRKENEMRLRSKKTHGRKKAARQRHLNSIDF